MREGEGTKNPIREEEGGGGSGDKKGGCISSSFLFQAESLFWSCPLASQKRKYHVVPYSSESRERRQVGIDNKRV